MRVSEIRVKRIRVNQGLSVFEFTESAENFIMSHVLRTWQRIALMINEC